MKFVSFIFLISLSGFILSCSQNSNQNISLAGEWSFQTDQDDQGLNEQWYLKNLDDVINLPGSMKENDKGDVPTLDFHWTGSIYDSSWYYNPRYEKYRQPGDLKFPFWLTPNKVYLGAAWYQKQVNIPSSWNEKQVLLNLERPHWETTVWLDSTKLGNQNSLSTPHVYHLPESTQPGNHTLTIRIDNRSDEVNVGPDSHSLTDHTQGNWNGIVGDISLSVLPKIYIDDLQVYPDVEGKMAKVVVVLQGSDDQKYAGDLHLQVSSFNTSTEQHIDGGTLSFERQGNDTIEMMVPMGDDVQLWDEFNPALYKLTATLTTKDGQTHMRESQFGMRDFTIDGKHFAINGRPIFLRGTVENCAFPLTGYAPMDEEAWMEVFKKCKATGLNHMRFHSFCPPEAAFVAADKIGFYLQPEAASWANHGTALGYGKPVDQYILDETERIIKTYGNHPSFCLWAYGNEPRGRYVGFLDEYLKYWKKKDTRRVYTGASIGMSWHIVPESEFLVRSGPRGLPFSSRPNSTFNFDEKIKDEFRPYVTHELGQHCVYPNFDEMEKYTGVYKAKNFELFQEDLTDHHMGDQAKDFLMASGKLQALCYKAEIEAELRTPDLAGYQLLGLNDYPGQGTALVGLLDVFWDEKGYITYDEIKNFQSETVPLALFNKFVFDNSETLEVPIAVTHYGAEALKDAAISWEIKDDSGMVYAHDQFPQQSLKLGYNAIPGSINLTLKPFNIAQKLNLSVKVNDRSNHWEFWVYPKTLPELKTPEVYECKVLDKKAEEVLAHGGKVFLKCSGKVENGKDVVQHFKPVFWNTSWFKMRPPHTTGVLIQDKHAAFEEFPTSYHSNYQWWSMLDRQQVMNLENFPPQFRPLVQPIDTWFLNRRLGLIIEAKVGEGKLLICSADLDSNSENRPAARQLNYSLLKYAESSNFEPKTEVSLEVVKELFEVKNREKIDFYTKDAPDELKVKVKNK